MKKILLFVLICFFSFFLFGCDKEDDTRIKIVSTNFVGYDFVRGIVGDDPSINNMMLLSPGEEAHDFELTPQNLINIENCSLFIYVGGESESWIDEILKNLDSDVKVVKMMDSVSLLEEEVVEGMEGHDDGLEDEEEYDEHVWTSPLNAISIINDIYCEIELLFGDKYFENKESYVSKIKNIDEEIVDIVENRKRDLLIFGDRFPLRYFVNRYGLKYYAAFPGCSHDTEASAKTISFLINKVRNEKIPYVLTIELSNKKIARVIAEETGVSVLEFNSIHNISPNDFKDGITYVDLMNKNIEVLKRVLY